MIHARSLAEAPAGRPALLTIGSFDGVHLGHQTLIRDLVTQARTKNLRAAVITFFPHPSVVLRGRKPSFYINTPEEKAALFDRLGVDVTVTHPFDRAVAEITATEFVERLLTVFTFKELWCGADFAFGHNREGNVQWLTEYGAKRGFTVHVVESISINFEVISSSRVRMALAEGDVAQAAACLGRPFQLPGTVVEGNRRGRAIGIPTANLGIWDERAYPAQGVYACRAWVDDQPVDAVTNIGLRPTFETDTQPTIEAHLLDFEADLYGKTVRLDFVARLRPEMKFNGVGELVAQIYRDIEQTREILKLQTPGTAREKHANLKLQK